MPTRLSAFVWLAVTATFGAGCTRDSSNVDAGAGQTANSQISLVHDFGIVQTATTVSHTFQLENDSDTDWQSRR